ncbi:Zn(2)-C6 fungal-type DNA-binding domain protein [Kalmanozyma brasiliensis GHG001]|uniref:Zn(2)-C6 fungal-type domain-containing protein n=1 Tax=Kalmanozyma brasiliensis (strain GHG001) TaxID=1365824 RepID=V5EY33_KALBG|nr:Zn(2)-C6 fungal-type DNA-binding domain protein [Kalmanozyma brasiliensis GHG001]EST07534.1 Zn(2)-C6 fungal-type DNA-binding domain protein [Kalmanozyma brasiliensis GHG001]
MSYKSEDEAHVAFELVSMRNGRSSISFDNSPAPPSTSTLPAPSPRTTAVSSGSPATSQKKRSKSSSDSKASSTAAASKVSKADDAASPPESKGKKRRRVVVACDTCRRKKIKCEGLPNPNNTCNNCTAYNYRCTFSSDADRSRGKYEILESKVETLLSALRSVAPHIAQQFDRGELNVTGPSGSSAPPQNANPWQSLESHDHSGNGKNDDDEDDELAVNDGHREASRSRHDHELPSRSASVRFAHDGHDADDADAAGDGNGNAGSSAEASKREDREALLPDVEDGRPRYFGRSSAMTLFNTIGDESRPPSPGAGAQRSSDNLSHHAGISYETHRHLGTRHAKANSSMPSAGAIGHNSGDKASSASAPRPLYPTNSKEWIQLLRRKNTVAVGRDDAATEEWFERYTLPDRDLIKDLLDVFFQQLHPLMPIVHRPSLERDLATGRADKDSAFRGFVFTILAIASRFSNDPRVLADSGDPDTAGDHFAAASRLYHQVYAASLINVQVMILTATFMHGAIGPGASWTVLGVAIRALQDIGLHQEKAYRGFSPYEQELRRRVFWGAFILDCIFSINMGRPLALKLSDCDVKVPLEIDDDVLFKYESGGPIPPPAPRSASDKPIVMSGFVHMIKLNVIVQDVVHVLYTPRWRQDGSGRGKLPGNAKQRAMPEYKDMVILSKRLEEWVAETPSHLRSIESPFRLQAGLVQCGTHDIRLYILKPFLEHSALRKMLHPQCVFHARECLRVVIALHEGDHMSDLVFIFQQAFMSTATFMITVWHECREVDKLAEDNDLVESTLRIFAAFDDRYFSRLFRRAHRILRDIALRSMHTMTSDQRERVSRMLVRADLRMSGVVPSTMTGMKSASGMMQPRADPTLPPSARMAARNERLDRRVSGQYGDSGGAASGGHLSNDPISAASYIHSWSPIPSAPMSPSRNSISEGSNVSETQITSAAFGQFVTSGAAGHAPGGVYSSGNGSNHPAGMRPMDGAPSPRANLATGMDATMDRMTTIHPASFGDARGIMPLYTDDPGSAQHQLEDLSWTDYFSKFLDDIGGANASMASNTPGGAGNAMGSYAHHSQAQMPNMMGVTTPQAASSGNFDEMQFAMGPSPVTPSAYGQHGQSPRRPPSYQ